MPAVAPMLQLVVQKSSVMQKRITISLLIGLGCGTFCTFVLYHLQQNVADFHVEAIHLAQRLVAHQNPYDTPLEQYPLPAAFLALPLLALRPEIAAGTFYGLSSALLAFGITRQNYTRLRIFVAYPFWAGLLTAQWSTIIAASAFFPLALPVTMMKPQVGLPIFLTRLSRRGFFASLVVAALSLAVLPRWPWLWLGQTPYYEHFIPLFVFPGPLLLLVPCFAIASATRGFCFSLPCMPPALDFFDSFTLWLIPKSLAPELLWTSVFLSWGAGIWRWYHLPANFHRSRPR